MTRTLGTSVADFWFTPNAIRPLTSEDPSGVRRVVPRAPEAAEFAESRRHH